MIPTLYEENETDFISNGLGRLTDAVSCVVTQNNKGVYELSMEYPLDGVHADDVTNNRFIYAVTERGKTAQPFRIRSIEKMMNGKMKVTARHICYDLAYYACKAFGQTDVVPYKFVPTLYNIWHWLVGPLDELTFFSVKVDGAKWVLTLDYPADGVYEGDLNTNSYIYAQPEIGRELVFFDITDIDRTTSETTITITAEAAIVPPVAREFNQMTVDQAVGYVSSYTNDVQTCPFTFSVHSKLYRDEWITTPKEFWSDIPKPAKSLLYGSEGSILDVFGGEWEFDHYNCIFHEERGSDNGVQYRYGKNIRSVTERINIDEIYTHAFSFWKGTASSSTNTAEGEYYTKSGTILRILDEEYETMFSAQRTLIIDASGEFENEPTTGQLDEYTLKQVKTRMAGTPTVTIDADIVDVAGMTEYEDIAALEQVNLYDTVTIVFPRLGINVKAKITEIEYDVLKNKNNRVIIGDVSTKLSNIIAQNKSDIVSAKYDLKKWADKAMERATQALAGWNGGNIRKNYNKNDHKQQSMYIMNADNVEEAGRAIKFDEYGIGVSGSGPEGSYSYMVNMSGGSLSFTDQFAGDGNTNASFLKRGTITGGNSTWNLENGSAYFELTGLKVNGDAYIIGNLLLGPDSVNVLTSLNGLAGAIGSLEGSISNLNGSIDDLDRRVRNLENRA